jgi:hypothetical protein
MAALHRDRASAIDPKLAHCGHDSVTLNDLAVPGRDHPGIAVLLLVFCQYVRAVSRVDADGDQPDPVGVARVVLFQELKLSSTGRSPGCEEVQNVRLLLRTQLRARQRQPVDRSDLKAGRQLTNPGSNRSHLLR